MLIPIQAEYYALEGLGQLLETVEMVRTHLNQDLEVSTIVLMPRGDLDRAQRQQQYLRALLTKVTSSGFLTNPLKFDELVRTAAGAITVDKRMPVQSLAFSLKGLRPANLTFMTLPIADSTSVPGVGSVLLPDTAQSAELFTALNNDTLGDYVIRHPPNDVSHGA